jgi:hypothetical protein
VRGSFSVSQFATTYSIATPPMPQTIATTTMTIRGAPLSLRKRKPAQRTTKATIGTKIETRIRPTPVASTWAMPLGGDVATASARSILALLHSADDGVVGGGGGARWRLRHVPVSYLGQLAAMLLRVVSMSCWPLMSLTLSVQNVPEPTAAGIASEPSKRTTGASTIALANALSSADV